MIHVARLLHGRNLPDIQPEEVLHIGDDIDNDYRAATACGFRALLLDPKGEAALPQGAVVRSLDEIPAKIDEMMIG